VFVSARDLIVQRIRERGPITVAEFMSIALYHPEHGYYARSGRRTGRNGDFFTSVDVGSLFGAALCRQFVEMWRYMPDGGGFDLVEAGASNGQLARDVLDAAKGLDLEFYRAIRLHLVEASPAARMAQREVLEPHLEKVASTGVRLPDVIHGVIYANELLDALPVHSVVMTDHGLREHYIDLMDDRLIERAGRPSTDALEHYFARLGIALQPGSRAEVNLSAISWVARASLALHRGFLLLIDYGHPARELYSPTHAAGTLTSFQGHVSETERAGAPAWLDDPGHRDITSHVDLTSIQCTAEELGCRTRGVLDQSYFLLALGLGEMPDHTESTVAGIRRKLRIKTLMVPGGLGSTHKVMIFSKEVEAGPLRGLSGPSRLT
jgi:SAM-dependent MidA family methyltransferase